MLRLMIKARVKATVSWFYGVNISGANGQVAGYPVDRGGGAAPGGTLARSDDDTPYAPELNFDSNIVEEGSDRANSIKYPVMRGRGEVGSALTCFAMIAQHLGMPFKRDVVQRVLTNQSERLGQLSLTACGAVADLVGLKPQLAKVPASAIARLPKLALIKWREGFAVIYETSQSEYVLGVPEENRLVRHSPQAFEEIWGPEGEILLVETTEQTPQQKFGLSWFYPIVEALPRGTNNGTGCLIFCSGLWLGQSADGAGHH